MSWHASLEHEPWQGRGHHHSQAAVRTPAFYPISRRSARRTLEPFLWSTGEGSRWFTQGLKPTASFWSLHVWKSRQRWVLGKPVCLPKKMSSQLEAWIGRSGWSCCRDAPMADICWWQVCAPWVSCGLWTPRGSGLCWALLESALQLGRRSTVC